MRYTGTLMSNLIYIVGIPLSIYVVLRYVDVRYHVDGSRGLLIAACLLFSLSIFLPSPIIDGEDTEFFTHLLGGGVFTGLIWLYLRPLIMPRKWYIELLHLFVFVSALGVVNELFELLTHSLGISPKSLTDTSWDLLANTLGVLLFYAGYRAIKYGKRLFLQG